MLISLGMTKGRILLNMMFLLTKRIKIRKNKANHFSRFSQLLLLCKSIDIATNDTHIRDEIFEIIFLYCRSSVPLKDTVVALTPCSIFLYKKEGGMTVLYKWRRSG